MSEDLLWIPVPALVAVLLNKERAKGSPLTEHEVLSIRDQAVCLSVPPDVHAKMVEERGYDDIDPQNVWEEWRELRAQFDLPG